MPKSPLDDAWCAPDLKNPHDVVYKFRIYNCVKAGPNFSWLIDAFIPQKKIKEPMRISTWTVSFFVSGVLKLGGWNFGLYRSWARS